MTPAWTGPLFSWTVPSHNEQGSRRFALVPPPDEPDEWELWRYRRIVDAVRTPTAAGCQPVQLRPDRLLGRAAAGRPARGARRGRSPPPASSRSASCTGCRPRLPGTTGTLGYPGLKLRGDELGSADGLALAPYIREPRRCSRARC
jgi:hypothetical protein